MALLAFFFSPAMAQDGPDLTRSPVEFTRDNKKALVQKDVGDAQWAITYELETGQVTGNIRFSDGGAIFVDCDREVSGDLVDTYRCFIANGCTEEPCSPSIWQAHSTLIELPKSFFVPPVVDPPPPQPPPRDLNPMGEPGCCQSRDAVGPCFDTSTSATSCLADNWTFVRGGRCAVVEWYPAENCAKAGIPPEACYRGSCAGPDDLEARSEWLR